MTPASGPVLVTGAAGGVGSVAVALLSQARLPGHRLHRAAEEAGYLKALGAAEVIDRAELSAPGRPMAKERWAGAIDSVGSHTLANALAQTKYGGTVAACGLAQGMDLPGSVAPFILRGVTLAGIDSVMAPLESAASLGASGRRSRPRQARRADRHPPPGGCPGLRRRSSPARSAAVWCWRSAELDEAACA